MKAVVVERPHQVSYREIDAPAVGADDVLVASREAGLCRTDIEVMTGLFTDPRWVHFPVIPGHEWSGTVVEVGATSSRCSAGDRVVCEGLIACHRCGPCRRGETHWCERIEALGFTRPGGYAELVTVPARVVHRLPDHVSFDAGVLVEPASVVLHGLEKARPQPGETVGVIGIGTLGSLAIALLRLHSPARIVAYGIREEELELARSARRERGRPDRRRRRRRARSSTSSSTPPGSPSAIALATEICRPGGRAVLLGIAGEGRSLTLPSDLLAGKDMALIGSLAYPAAVWSRVVGLVSDRVLELDPIVTHRFPVAEFQEAIRLMDDRDGIVAKIVLEHYRRAANERKHMPTMRSGGYEHANGRRSSEWLDRHDLDGFLHRSWLKSTGVGDETFRGRPVIGICNTWSELVNCNVHLRGLAEAVKRGVLQAGGFPREFPVMSLGESLMKPTAMLYRNLMAMDVEESIRSYPLDGVVLLTGCDKTNPASIMGACSANIPTIVVTGGPMLNGHWRGRELGSCSDCWHYHEELRAGRITEGDFTEIENSMSRSNGHCMTMGTASTMACMTEALGLTLPGAAAIPAVDSRRAHVAEAAGRQIVELVERNIRPRTSSRGGVRERDPHAARDLRLDQRDHPPDRVRGPRRSRAAAGAVRRAVRHDAVAGQPQAGRRPPDGGLLLRGRAAGGARADSRSAARRRADGDRRDARREPRRGPTEIIDETVIRPRRSRSTRAAHWSCCAATCAPTVR